MVKRIAVVGILLETNAFAPNTRLDDFESYFWREGDALSEFIAELGLCNVAPETVAFVPILVAGAESGGPVIHDDYQKIVRSICRKLEDVDPLDGVFIFAHGAGSTTVLEDLDGDYFSRIREVVGREVPIVAELDLHANLSDEMVDAVDMLIAYRTNPHIDIAERAQDCVKALLRLIDGAKVHVAFEKLPLITAQVAQLISENTPYGDVIRASSLLIDEDPDVAEIALMAGFAFSDIASAGFSVYVASWKSNAHARQICHDFSRLVWGERGRFVASPYSIEDAVWSENDAQKQQLKGPRIYADIADNPGGGGRGNCVHIVRSFAESGLKGIQAAAFYDPELVLVAERAGEGTDIDVVFNSNEASPLSGTWKVRARIERLFYGEFVNKCGAYAGQVTDLGRSCLLSVNEGDIKIVVVSHRNQVFNPQFFTCAGLDPEIANALIVKSRGHFRAGFDHISPPENIFEVDGPGLVSADIGSIDWTRLPAPSYPMDPDTSWVPSPKTKPPRGDEVEAL